MTEKTTLKKKIKDLIQPSSQDQTSTLTQSDSKPKKSFKKEEGQDPAKQDPETWESWSHRLIEMSWNQTQFFSNNKVNYETKINFLRLPFSSFAPTYGQVHNGQIYESDFIGGRTEDPWKTPQELEKHAIDFFEILKQECRQHPILKYQIDEPMSAFNQTIEESKKMFQSWKRSVQKDTYFKVTSHNKDPFKQGGLSFEVDVNPEYKKKQRFFCWSTDESPWKTLENNYLYYLLDELTEEASKEKIEDIQKIQEKWEALKAWNVNTNLPTKIIQRSLWYGKIKEKEQSPQDMTLEKFNGMVAWDQLQWIQTQWRQWNQEHQSKMNEEIRYLEAIKAAFDGKKQNKSALKNEKNEKNINVQRQMLEKNHPLSSEEKDKIKRHALDLFELSTSKHLNLNFFINIENAHPQELFDTKLSWARDDVRNELAMIGAFVLQSAPDFFKTNDTAKNKVNLEKTLKIIHQTLLAMKDHHHPCPLAMEDWNKPRAVNPVRWVAWTFENEQVKQAWDQRFKDFEEWIDNPKLSGWDQAWPSFIEEGLTRWMNGQELQKITMDMLEDWRLEIENKKIEKHVDPMFTQWIKKTSDKNHLTLDDSKIKIIERLRILKTQWLEAVSQEKEAPWGIPISSPQQDPWIQWLGVSEESFRRWSEFSGSEWLSDPPHDVSEKEWTQELVANKIREWRQWVVKDASMDSKEMKLWNEKFQELQNQKEPREKEKNIEGMDKNIPNENEASFNENEGPSGSAPVMTPKQRLKNIESELWLQVLDRHFNDQPLLDESNPQERQQALQNFRQDSFSKGGWKKLHGSSEAFAQLVFKKALKQKDLANLKAKIKHWSMEEWNRENQAHEIGMKDKQWTGLGGNPTLLSKNPLDWKKLGSRQHGAQQTQIKKSMAMDAIKDNESLIRKRHGIWVKSIMNAASQYQWNDAFVGSVMLWGGIHKDTWDYNQVNIDKVFEENVNPALLWGTDEDFRSLKEGLEKEKQAKATKIMRWLNGCYRHYETLFEKQDPTCDRVLKNAWKDLWDVQTANPFDFFDQLQEKDPYRHACQWHDQMVEAKNKEEIESKSQEKFKTEWTDLLQNPQEHGWIREIIKRQKVCNGYSKEKMNEDLKSLVEGKTLKDREENEEMKEQRKQSLKAMNPVEVTLLDSERALALEGKKMHHCVGNQRFYDQCKNGKSIIFHLHNKTTGAVATLMFDRLDNEWKMNQNRGKYNASVQDEGLLAVTDDLMKTLNMAVMIKKIKPENAEIGTKKQKSKSMAS